MFRAIMLTMSLLVWGLLCLTLVAAAWQDNLTPKRYTQIEEESLTRFNTSAEDHFKLILPDGEFMLIGSRNVIYNVTLIDMKLQNRVDWPPHEDQIKTCYMMGVSNALCQNYVRILTKKTETDYLICGTNAFSPYCREYKLTNGVLELSNSYKGRGLCPYDPSLNTTAIYADGQLYVATTTDFSGVVPLIYRDPLMTAHSDLYTLNLPNFVSSFALGDFVYFFFREVAVEYLNCGKTLYSRVARVCRHDKGGPHKFKNKWTSYLKSRLNCSISGNYPFYFNEIQATTDPIEGRYGGHATTLLYGVFTTPENSIAGSAVCAYTFQDIMDTFEGAFKGKESANANWLPVKVPEPRPGQCVKDSSTLPDVTLNFIKTHPLMDEAVPAFFGRPLLMRTSYHSSGRFTAITVDPQVRTADDKYYDILYIGTDEGKVVKALNTKSADSYEDVESVIIEELTVFSASVVVSSVKLVKVRHTRRLIVVSLDGIVSLPLHRCRVQRTCSECVGLQDPYCGWDRHSRNCVPTVPGKDLVQDISEGTSPNCTKERPSHAPSVDNKSPLEGGQRAGDTRQTPRKPAVAGGAEPNGPVKSIPLQFTAETLAIAVASAAIGALILGFITGFFCGKKCNKDDDNQLYAVTDYEYYDQRQNPNSRLTSDIQDEVTYAEPVLVPQSHKPINLLHMSPKATLKNPPPSAPNQSLHGPPMNLSGAPIGPSNTGPAVHPLSFTLAMAPPSSVGPQGAQPDIPLHYTPESYSTHGTLRSSEKFGTRGRGEHKRDLDHRLDGFSTTRSVKKVYL